MRHRSESGENRGGICGHGAQAQVSRARAGCDQGMCRIRLDILTLTHTTHRTRKHQVGHLIVSVDGVDVSNLLCALPPLVLGLEGSKLSIGFIRAPGEAVRFVEIVRGGATGGPRSVSSLHGESQWATRKHARSTLDESQLPERPHTSSGMYENSLSRVDTTGSDLPKHFADMDDVLAIRIDTGASSVMELSTHFDISAMEPPSPRGRRSRSVAVGLPCAGPKMPYIVPTPSWHIDLRPAEPSTYASFSNRVHTREGTPSIDSRRQHSSAGMAQLSPTAVQSTLSPRRPKKTPDLQSELNGEISGELAGVNSAEYVVQEELDEQQKQALTVFARTPEGKMWKAERAREKSEAYKQKRTEWAANSVLSELSGGKFSTAKHKTDLDWIVYYATQLPGAGAYNPQLPLREGRKDLKKTGTKFGTANRFGPDTVDHSIPGAGAYHPKTSTFSTAGGKFNGSDKVKKDV